MAKKVTVTLVDDFDGEGAADETVEFGLDGVSYEIDLFQECQSSGTTEAMVDAGPPGWRSSARAFGLVADAPPRPQQSAANPGNGTMRVHCGRIPADVDAFTRQRNRQLLNFASANRLLTCFR
jgi:hypothetical protein